MFKFLTILALISIAFGQTEVPANVVTRGLKIPASGSLSLRHIPNVTIAEGVFQANFQLIACSGTYTAFRANGTLGATSRVCDATDFTANTIGCAYIQTNGSWVHDIKITGTVDSQFDFIVYYNNSKSTWLPSIPGSSQQSTANKAVTIAWPGTSDSRDSYAVYTYAGTAPTGYRATACGVKLYATLRTDITIDGPDATGYYTTTFSQLARDEQLLVTPFLIRSGQYEAAYAQLQIGSGSNLSVYIGVVVLSILVALLF